MNRLNKYFQPETIADLIAELVANHAEMDETGEFLFNSEDARNVYAVLLDAGIRNCGQTRFFDLVDAAVDLRFNKELQ